MNFKRFATPPVLMSLVIGLMFLKIYQHNLIIKLSYETQRLERKSSQLEKDRNDLLMAFYNRKDPINLQVKARDEWGMKNLTLSQVITLTAQAPIDFLHTTSHIATLKTLNLYDAVVTRTGRRL